MFQNRALSLRTPQYNPNSAKDSDVETSAFKTKIYFPSVKRAIILLFLSHLPLLDFVLVLLPFFFLDVVSPLAIQVLLAQLLEVGVVGIEGFLGGVVEADGGPLLEGDLGVVVDAPLFQPFLPDRDAGGSQFTPFLQRGQSTRFFQLLLASLPLGFLALC